MDFIDEIRQFAGRIEQLKDQIITEEATKTSFIMPFFQLLGYDVFNPSEFVPEYTADVGIKKGEKVDYTIMDDGTPIILIEAKWCGEGLKDHSSQLYRYFSVTKAKFAILTNGVEYHFYTDLDEPNKMDEKPFLEFSFLNIKESSVNELKKFTKQNFDLETIFSSASELKYTNQIKQLMKQQLNNPSDTFVSYVLSEVYQKRKTQNVIDNFREVVKKSFNQFINELMNERIKSALERQDKQDVEDDLETEEIISKIITTEEELEAYFIVKTILKEEIPTNRIQYKDTESYFGIIIDNSSRKWICRLYINRSNKYIIIPDEQKNNVKHSISSVEDIYQLKEHLIEALHRYLA